MFQLPPQCAKNRYITHWAEKAGIERRVSFHTSRHTAATLLLESGADLFTVQRILGHTKADQTMIYAKVTDPLKRKAVEGLPKIKMNSYTG